MYNQLSIQFQISTVLKYTNKILTLLSKNSIKGIITLQGVMLANPKSEREKSFQ